MAIKKTATKTSSKAKLNLNIFGNKKQTKKQEKEIEKTVKKSSFKTLIASLFLIIVGFTIGAGAYFLVCKNDTFEIVGNDEITLTLDETYEDPGVKIIEFGKDISENATVKTNLSKNDDGKYYSNEIGTFYIEYSVDSIKYGKVFKIGKPEAWKYMG